MSVQAKVRCVSNAQPVYDTTTTGESRLVRFTPVYDSDPEHPNFEWSKATPAGYLELYITNPAAHGQFEVNAEYLLTFEKVEAPA